MDEGPEDASSKLSLLRAGWKRAALRWVRFYTRHAPLRRGKYRLMTLVLPYTSYLPDEMVVDTRDGRQLWVDWHNGMAETIYFLGEYERAVTHWVTALVQSGDTCLDIGASTGWYTTLLRTLCGDSGEVHAFEPLPSSYRQLERNLDLMGNTGNIVANRLALGDRCATVTLHRFPGLPDGHTSLSAMGRDRLEIVPDVGMTTFDAYSQERQLGPVAFAKVDIEGAERMFFNGASVLFRQPVPPILIVEMALDTTAGFGYRPNDLIEQLAAQHPYRFFAIDEVSCGLSPLERFAAESSGAYVLCVPQGLSRRRLARLGMDP